MMTWAELVDCRSLVRGSHLDVETSSRHYQIECLGGDAIRISGHPRFCPEPVTAKLDGADGLIGPGMRLRFTLDEDNQAITTTRVLSVHVDPPAN